MLECVFFGGAGDHQHGELGGVQLLMNDLDLETKVMVDCGQRPDHYNQFINFPYSPKRFQALDIAKMFKFYPNLAGLFRSDLDNYGQNGQTKIPLDAIILTHAHYDHAGGLPLIRPDLPVWMHPLAKKILYWWQETSGRTVNQFVDVYEQSLIPDVAGGERFSQGRIAKVSRDIRLFEKGKPFKVRNMDITHYLTDHSLPGSGGFCLETSVGNIGISGDIRLRGRRRADTENFVNQLLKKDLSYLFWEGSLLHFDHEGTEDDVTQNVYELIKDRGFAAIAYPPRDFDRILSCYKAAKKDDRMLVVSPAQALMLKSLDGENGYPRLNWKHIGVYLHRKNKGLLDKEDYSDQLIQRDYAKWERQFLKCARWDQHQSKPQRVSIDDLASHQDKFLTFMPANYMMDMLTEISKKTGGKIKNGIYIRSHPAPWTPEMEIQEQLQINILNHFGMYDGPRPDYLTPIEEKKMHQVHITGHLNRRETRDTLGQFNCPIIPYHCMYPQDFIDDVAKHTNVIIPQLGEKIILT